MKLLIGALALTVSLSAYAGSNSSKLGNIKFIDGNYVAGNSVNDKILEYTEIANGKVKTYEINLENNTYAVTLIALSMSGDKVVAKALTHSCFGDISGAQVRDDEQLKIILKNGVLTVSDSEGSHLGLQVSAKQSTKIKSKISELKLLQGSGCEDYALAEDSDTTSLEKTKSILESFLKD